MSTWKFLKLVGTGGIAVRAVPGEAMKYSAADVERLANEAGIAAPDGPP